MFLNAGSLSRLRSVDTTKVYNFVYGVTDKVWTAHESLEANIGFMHGVLGLFLSPFFGPFSSDSG